MDEITLRKLARRHRVPIGVLEKDYVLTILLYKISGFPRLGEMTFKGGTALKKAYFVDFRFSEDLDFACTRDVSGGFVDFLGLPMQGLGIEFDRPLQVEQTGQSVRLSIKYAQLDGFKTSVKVDLSLRGDVILGSPARPILHSYDTPTAAFSMPVLSLEEIMAEKVRALVYARHPRHLYDVYYLDGQGVKIRPDLVRAKIRSAYGEDFSLDKLEERIAEKEARWMDDLQPLLPTPLPSFGDVSQRMLGTIRRVMR